MVFLLTKQVFTASIAVYEIVYVVVVAIVAIAVVGNGVAIAVAAPAACGDFTIIY